jgi:hypothetical protein
VRRDVAVSALNVLLGVWLFATSFLWQHTAAGRVSTSIVGLLAVAIGLAAWRAAAAFYLDLLLAAWLVASIWLLPHHPFASWNEAMVAIGLLLVPITMRLFPAPPGERRAQA